MVSISRHGNTISSAVKLSYNIVKGSPEKRKELVADYTDKIFDGFIDKIDDYSIKFSDIRRSIDKVLPEKKKYSIRSYNANENALAESNFIYNGDDIVGLTIEVPAKDKKLPQDQIGPFMHELTHMVDRMVNPKYTARVKIATKRNLYGDPNYNDVFFDKLYNYENINACTPQSKKDEIIAERRKEVEEFLKGKKVQDKIEYIQDFKNTLIMEKNAFDAEHKYALKLRKRDIPADDNALNDSRIQYMFDEKIQMLKNLGADIIQRVRKAHATGLANKKRKINGK